MPTLILTPDGEAGMPNRLRPLIPDVRTVVVRDAGHMLNMEQPEAFADALLSFLTTSSPAA